MCSWPVLVVLFFIPAAAWAISNPLFAVPDEPAHVTKAVSIWYGELERPQHPPGTGLRTYPPPGLLDAEHPCFAFHADMTPTSARPAAGQPPGDRRGHAVGRLSRRSTSCSWVGRSRLFPNAFGIYLMRLVSALLCAVFLAAAVKALQTGGASRPGRGRRAGGGRRP